MSAPQSIIDRAIIEVDKGLRTLTSAHHAKRSTPKSTSPSEHPLDERARKHSAGLMRINHCGEVCAQALYQGQALSAQSLDTQHAMQEAADEEIDHLVWCEQRLESLDSRTSHLNPLWYGLSFGLGAVTGKLGDKISLGFVAATEEQVCHHLEEHLAQLPKSDSESRAVIEQMISDERAHGQQALDHGGTDFPKPVKGLMSLVSKVMTKTSYHI